MSTFLIKRGDLVPVASTTLTYSDGSVPNLTGATVRFVMRNPSSTTPTVNAAATILNPTIGTVQYTWTAGDTATAGSYYAEWVVTYADTTTQTFPTDGYQQILIEPDLAAGPLTDYSPLTTADLIADTRRLLLGRERQSLNQLAANVDAVTTTVPFTQPLAGIQGSAVINVGLEEMLVWSVNNSAGTATVLRGYNGSTAAPHTAGDVVAVNPKFSNWEIFTALNADLHDLSTPENGLFQIRTLDLTAMPGQLAYDFPATGYLDLADIRWQVPGTVTHEWRELGATVNEQLPTSAFPSGAALTFDRLDLPVPQQTVRVRYKATFGALTGLTDNVAATTGLPVTALDIPPLGAAVRLMDGRPVGRADYLSQGDTRRADEVRVADVLNASQHLELRRQRRINAEYLRLTAIWDVRLRPRVRL